MANILLVDDDAELVELLGELLRHAGHDVRTAHDGEAGLRVLRSAPLPDAVVLDVDMPILGGAGMVQRMLLSDAGEDKLPIVLISGRNDLPALAKAIGTPYFLRKPHGAADFLALVARAVLERTPPTSA